jgi:hypothetical protein
VASLKDWTVDEAGLMAALRSDGVTKLIAETAQAGVEVARSLAPVWSGDYRDSFGVIPMQVIEGRIVGGFGSSSWHWHFVEYGAPHTPASAVLRNAALAVVGGTSVEIL